MNFACPRCSQSRAVRETLGMFFENRTKLSRAREVRTALLTFGEELTKHGGRTPQLGYTGDSTRQRFTSKERHSETGLDYFKARFYSSAQGNQIGVKGNQIGVRPAILRFSR